MSHKRLVALNQQKSIVIQLLLYTAQDNHIENSDLRITDSLWG